MYEELKKSYDGLAGRLSVVEDILAEMGTAVEEDKTIGASPSGQSMGNDHNDAFDEINKKRLG